MLKTVCLIIAINAWVSMADIPVPVKKEIHKVYSNIFSTRRCQFIVGFVAKRISPQNPSNITFGTQSMVTQTITDSLYILRIHVTKVTWTWGNNERKTNSIVSTSPRDLPRLSPVACRDAGLATQNFTKITSKCILVTEKWTFRSDKDAIYWTFHLWVIFQVPPEVARRRISFSEPEKMNFVGRKMTTLSIK